MNENNSHSSLRVFRPQDYGADSLWKICLRFCAKYPLTFCVKEVTVGESVGKSEKKESHTEEPTYILRSSVFLPSQLSDALLAELLNQNEVLTEPLLHIFTDLDKCQLRNLNLRGSCVTDKHLSLLMKHNPVHLNLIECSYLTSQSLLTITTQGQNLVSLSIGAFWGLFSDLDFAHDGQGNSEVFQLLLQHGPRLPQLRALTLRGLEGHPSWQTTHVLQWFLKPSPPLTYIDISSCDVALERVENLSHLSTLSKLVAHNVKCREETFVQISRCKNLQALDISQTQPNNIHVTNPGQALIGLLKNLPKLRWLDISGTNLCSESLSDESREAGDVMESVFTKGLEGRQLDFLGLLMCAGSPCLWPGIPAAKITGEYQEDQILLALEMYVQRPQFLRNALFRLLNTLRSSHVSDLKRTLLVVLEAMRQQKRDGPLQQMALGCLVYTMTRSVEHHDHIPVTLIEVTPPKLKQQLVLLTLEAMETHNDIVVLPRRGCLVFRYLSLPDDLLFVYERAVRLLLRLTNRLDDENLVQLVLYIMKHLSSQVDIALKEKAGEVGAVEVMLELIKYCLATMEDSEDVLKAVWSILWSLTDMAQGNSERFINHGGMELFSKCYENYQDASLQRKIIGMMVNIAEVEACRPQLMTSLYITIFLDQLPEEPCISTSACGVLAHILADGASAWTVDAPSRDEVREKVRETVQNWDLEVPRKVRYRSFEPLHRLFKCWHTPEAQYWAIWDVRSMVQKDPARYIPMLEREGAIELLATIMSDSRVAPHVSELIGDILHTYNGAQVDSDYPSD